MLPEKFILACNTQKDETKLFGSAQHRPDRLI